MRAMRELQAHADRTVRRATTPPERFKDGLPIAASFAGVFLVEIVWVSGSDGGSGAAESNAYDVYAIGESLLPDAFTVTSRRIGIAMPSMPIFRGSAGKITRAANFTLGLAARDASGALVFICALSATPQRRLC